MQQQQPSSIIRQRLALRARSRMALCAMLAALILGPKCRASAEESAFHLHFDCRALKRCQQNYHRFYMFSFAIHVRNMDMIDQAT